MGDFERMLQMYGDLAVRVALNVQPGQRLLIVGPLANGGVSLDAAPLVRSVAASAYDAGAPLVEAIWGDEALQLTRFGHAAHDSFTEYSAWLPTALINHVESGHAVLSISANDPDLLKGQSPELVGAVQQATSRSVLPFREHISRNRTNWAVIAAASAEWAAKVFPGSPAETQMPSLWEAICRLCRLDRPDPVAAWQAHLEGLAARCNFLNGRHYSALKYVGPDTNLTIGLPEGHLWVSGRTTNHAGTTFTANIPTEEVFTIPHKNRVDGIVRSTKPLSYGSTMIEDFTLRFEQGRVVGLTAGRGQAVLQQLVDTDPGAARLGELALVPHSSPVSQSGLLFYNTLFDENAASHVALGSAYKFTYRGGESMSESDFESAGGNRSAVHVDLMIGSGELDIDGVLGDGSVEPLMRRGEWAADCA